MRIFGEPWDAPVCEGQTAEPEPIGQFCMTCDEMINVGDQGYIMACYGLNDDGSHKLSWHPQHRECSLLTVIGHNYGYCHCTDYQGMTERQAALRVWAMVQADAN